MPRDGAHVTRTSEAEVSSLYDEEYGGIGRDSDYVHLVYHHGATLPPNPPSPTDAMDVRVRP